MEHWTCRHFSLGNARDDEPTNLPKLLRRLADRIEAEGIGPMDVLDLVIRSEIEDFGPWWSAAVYWKESDERSSRPALT